MPLLAYFTRYNHNYSCVTDVIPTDVKQSKFRKLRLKLGLPKPNPKLG